MGLTNLPIEERAHRAVTLLDRWMGMRASYEARRIALAILQDEAISVRRGTNFWSIYLKDDRHLWEAIEPWTLLTKGAQEEIDQWMGKVDDKDTTKK